jgi:acylphosphatase
MRQTLSIIVSGKVQGVYYRQSAKLKALEIGLTGTVMNLPDNTVQVIITGTQEQINQLVEWCRKGPPKAIVTNIIVKELPLQSFTDFTITRF